jgi:hypothetical protein
LSKLEEEYMAKAMQRQKDGITKPQIVAGREFKGTSFISKPDKIIFKVTVFDVTYFIYFRTSLWEFLTLRLS